jgi:mRNA-degrading endonuclease RelE of RelBE toxin-antitoxin system
LEESPLFGPNIKRLKRKLKGSFRYQIRRIRVIFNVDMESRKVFVETIGARGGIHTSIDRHLPKSKEMIRGSVCFIR